MFFGLYLHGQVFYILARCSYFKDECGDKDKKGIKRLLNNGTYTAAFPLHDVSLFQSNLETPLSFFSGTYFYCSQIVTLIYAVNDVVTCVFLCICSAGTGQGQRILTAKVRDTVCTNTGPGSFVSSKSSPSTL